MYSTNHVMISDAEQNVTKVREVTYKTIYIV